MEFNKTDITRLLDGMGYALGNNFDGDKIILKNFDINQVETNAFIQASGYIIGKDGYKRIVNIELQKEKVDLKEQADK